MITKYSHLKLAGATKQQIDTAASKLNISPEELLKLVNKADPTKEKKFEAWLIKQLVFKNIRLPEDAPRIKQVLENFIDLSNKNQLKQRDIQRYKTIQDLETEIDAIKETEVTEETSEKLKEYLSLPGVSILGQNKEWLILSVKEPESASTLALGTKWCTSNPETAKNYILANKGLYVVFAKEGTALNKYGQFTGDFSQFKDLKDLEIDQITNSLFDLAKLIGLPEGLAKRTEKGIIEFFLKNGVWNGSLTLNFSTPKFPENLSIGGDLIITKDFKGDLSQIQSLDVKYTLLINNPAIESLPVSINVGGDCKIYAPIKNSPKKLHVFGDVTLSGGFPKLPEDFFCASNISLGRSDIEEIPENLEVHGSLNLNNSKIKSLPSGLKIKGDLSLEWNPYVKIIPEDAVIARNLELANSAVERLPEKAKGFSSLNLENTKVIALPPYLSTNFLNINYTNIASLPEKGKVYVNFSAQETVFEEIPDFFFGPKMNAIFLSGNKNLKKLPANILCDVLELENCESLTELPPNLETRELYLYNTGIRKLPEDLVVTYISGTNKFTGVDFSTEYQLLKEKRDQSSYVSKRICKYSALAMKYQPEDIPPQKGYGEIKEYEGFKFQSFSANPTYSLFLLDVEKFNKDWSKDKEMYVGAGGRNQTQNRYNDFKTWITKHPEYVIITPYVAISENSQKHPVSFSNGRHRFSVLRDMGLKKIWVTIHNSQRKVFADRYS